MKKALYYTLLFLVVSMAAALLASIVYAIVSGGSVTHTLGANGTSDIPVEVTLTGTIVGNIALIALFLSLHYCPISRHYVKTKPWKVALWCCIASLGTILPSLWLEDHLSFLPDLTNGMKGMFGTPLGYLAIVVCAPICEEIVFRGAVIRALMNWKPNVFVKPDEQSEACSSSAMARKGRMKSNWKLAVVISALLFSIAHLNPAQMPHAFLLGLLLGWVFVRTGSVVPGIIIHGVNNLTVYIIASSVPGIEDMSLADLYGGSETKALLSVLFSLLILLPALFQLHLNMKRE